MPMAVANRYASALADVVGPGGDYRKVLQELQDFAAAYRESLELRQVFESPAATSAQKVRVLEAIEARLAGSPLTMIFLRVLLVNYRMPLIEEVVQAFHSIANDRMGVVQVIISSASHLAEAERESVASRFRELTGKQVELEFRIDSELLGGIRAQIGNTVYDGSVRGNLARIREQLTAR